MNDKNINLENATVEQKADIKAVPSASTYDEMEPYDYTNEYFYYEPIYIDKRCLSCEEWPNCTLAEFTIPCLYPQSAS